MIEKLTITRRYKPGKTWDQKHNNEAFTNDNCADVLVSDVNMLCR